MWEKRLEQNETSEITDTGASVAATGQPPGNKVDEKSGDLYELSIQLWKFRSLVKKVWMLKRYLSVSAEMKWWTLE